MATQDGISKEQVRKMFDLFDADQSGTIDRSELRVLCFALGRALNEDQLEAALQEMDADGNGTIDYEELEAFILGDAQQDSESISGALQFALRRKLLAAQAKDLMNRLGFASKKAPKGNVQINTSFTTGNTFPVPGAAPSSGAAEGKEAPSTDAADPPFKLHLQVGAEGAIASVRDLGAEEGETEAIQLVVGVGPQVTADSVGTVQRLLDELLRKGADIMDMMDEPMPVTRVTVEGPLPSPVAGTTGNAIVFSVFLRMNLAEQIGENIDLDDILDSDVLDSDDEEDGKSDSDSDASETDFEGHKMKTRHVHEVVKRILQKLEVTLQANHSLQELIEGSRCDEGGSLDVQMAVNTKISKAMLQLMSTVIQKGAYRATSRYGDERKKGARSIIGLGLLSGVNKLESHMHFDADRMFNLTAAAGLGEDRPVLADLSPARLLAVLLEGFVFQNFMESLELDEPPAAGMDIMAQVLASDGAGGDVPVPVSAPSEELISQIASSDGEEDIQGNMMAAGFGMFKWFTDAVLDIRSVRAAGGGLAVHLQASGLNTQYMSSTLATVHATRKALVAQAAEERAVPGLLVLAGSPQYSAAIRGTTTEKADSSWSTPDHHIPSHTLPNFNQQFQLTLRGIGAVDYMELFEHVREEDGDDLTEAFKAGPAAFREHATKMLQRPKVLPPSGVRGPFGVLVVLPASIFPASLAECGACEDPASTDEVANARALIDVVNARVQALNEEFPEQPSEAMWTVMVDCHGGKVSPGLADAVRSALGLAQAHVAIADFGSSLGVVTGLSAAVQPVAKACDSPAYIALRADRQMKLPGGGAVQHEKPGRNIDADAEAALRNRNRSLSGSSACSGSSGSSAPPSGAAAAAAPPRGRFVALSTSSAGTSSAGGSSAPRNAAAPAASQRLRSMSSGSSACSVLSG